MITDRFLDFLKGNFGKFLDDVTDDFDRNIDIDDFLKTLFSDPRRRQKVEEMFAKEGSKKRMSDEEYERMSSFDKFNYYYEKFEQEQAKQQQQQQYYQEQEKNRQSYQNRNSNSNNKQNTTIEQLELKFYQALEVKKGATFEEIKSSYKKLMKMYHPDKFHNDVEKQKTAVELSKKINEAYTYFEKKFNKK